MSGTDSTLVIERPPPWSDGRRSERLHIRYRSWGRLSPERDNAVLVCPALTGNRAVDAWWPGLLGEGRSLDPRRDFIVAADVFGGSGGTSGPPAGGTVAVRDMVQAQALLLDALGIGRLALAIGGSLGGMQVLEWLAGRPERLDAAVVIAAPARQSAWAAGLNHVQRRALDRYGDLELARMVAMLSYRHWDDFEHRLRPDGHGRGTIAGWLDHHGDALRARFAEPAYRRLIEAMDRHDIGAGRGGWSEALGRAAVPTLVVGISSDLLYPPAELRRVAAALPAGQWSLLDSPHGHDAFLIDQHLLNRSVRAFRDRQTAASRPKEACA